MGVVCKAEDVRLKRMVALKFLPAHLTQDEAQRKRLLLEARAASSLDHPNICTIHEIEEAADGQIVLVMASMRVRRSRRGFCVDALSWSPRWRLPPEFSRACSTPISTASCIATLNPPM